VTMKLAINCAECVAASRLCHGHAVTQRRLFTLARKGRRQAREAAGLTDCARCGKLVWKNHVEEDGRCRKCAIAGLVVLCEEAASLAQPIPRQRGQESAAPGAEKRRCRRCRAAKPTALFARRVRFDWYTQDPYTFKCLACVEFTGRG